MPSQAQHGWGSSFLCPLLTITPPSLSPSLSLLLPNIEQVSKEEGQAAADKYGMHFFETSAKTGTNVKRAFTTIAQEVVQLQEDMEERQAQATAASAVEAAGNKKCSIS